MLSGCTFGHPPMTDKAQVLQKDGVPCFTIKDSRKTRNQPPKLRAIIVYTSSGDGYSEGPQREIWSIQYTNNPPLPTISPEQCISYTGPLDEFETNRLYSVTLHTESPDNVLPYRRVFCFVADENGTKRIEQVERHDYEICKTTVN